MAFGLEFLGHRLRLGVHVQTVGAKLECGAEDAVEQDIPGLLVGGVAAGHAAFQQHMAFQADMGSRGGGLSDMVGLDGALGDQHVGLFAQRLANQEFQLRVLLPPVASPVQSSRLMNRRGPPRCSPSRVIGSIGVGR